MNPRLLLVVGLVLAAAAARLIPHPPNFTPITAIALFGGACFPRRWHALVVCFAAMFLSDLVLGFHDGVMFVYGAFAVVVGLGMLLRAHWRLLPLVAVTLLASVQFFIVTNFGSWLAGHMYPRTLTGLGEAYAAGIPFFRNMLAGDVFYTLTLFGLYALAEWLIVSHGQQRSAAPL